MSELINVLSKLKKSSEEAVETVGVFEEFQEYMHVERQVDKDFEEVLRNSKSGNKKLILICGSVGDGKSHMLARISKINPELVEGYEINNDASESKYPNETSQKRLAQELSEFSDDKLDNGSNSKVIVAINLGTLAAFLDSEFGEKFGMLKEYVDRAGILYTINTNEHSNSYFTYVNFADYHLYELNNGNIESKFLTELFDKIFGDHDSVFNRAVKKYDSLSASVCPVYANYMFLRDENVRKGIINIILRTIVENKILLSTRNLLNFIYDIVVSPHMDNQTVINGGIQKLKLSQYISSTTPFLLFENPTRSEFNELIVKADPMKNRSIHLDETTIEYNYAEDIMKIFSVDNRKKIYGNTINGYSSQISYKNNRNMINKLGIRLEALYEDLSYHNDVFKQYIETLYAFITGNKQALKGVYSDVINAVYRWNGDTKRGEMALNTRGSIFSVNQEVIIKASVGCLDKSETALIHRFDENLRLTLVVNKNNGSSELICVIMDYQLFDLVNKIKNGYRVNLLDKNIHTNFDDVVKKIITKGMHKEKVVIYEQGHSAAIVVERSEFDDGTVFSEVSNA